MFLSTYQPFTVAEILLNTLERKKKADGAEKRNKGKIIKETKRVDRGGICCKVKVEKPLG